jgi:hypothetical protein
MNETLPYIIDKFREFEYIQPMQDFINTHKTCETLNIYTKKLLKFCWNTFSDEFWKKENVKSTEINLFGPIGIYPDVDPDSKEFGWSYFTIKNGKLVRYYSLPFAIYDVNNKKFYLYGPWAYLFNDNFFAESKLGEIKCIENVNDGLATELAVLFRTVWYEKGIIYTHTSTKKDLKTNNLIVSQAEYEKGKYIKIYSLVDFGISDPKTTKQNNLQVKISTLRMFLTLLKNPTKKPAKKQVKKPAKKKPAKKPK